ncbi:Signal transduction histidine kinase [Flavobacterium sp. CF108]|uniref:HAMP domain-containing protein n=1 Tax=unclassified Flavobacterium TaxID=196869 RepID=UPI0008D72CE2|nr:MULTISPECIES: HAMP domain-containing protein [unclassified Flavobacterium]SEO70065.1 Signal transduction histidine kinase [Flavobacterium sp. fv08]SHH90744.1 Signal transduction histidine kinase [Flavobacterium sp. CF108]
MKKAKHTDKAPENEVLIALPIITDEKKPSGTKVKKIEPEESILNDAEFLKILLKVKNGNFSQRFPTDQNGIKRSICDTLNEIIDLNERMVFEFQKVGKSIGKQGKLNNRVVLDGARGSWSSCVDSVNTLISDLVHPTIEIAHVITSVAKGNLSQEMPLSIEGNPLQGEFLRIAKEVNGMVKQLNLFSMEVTRVAREVGTDGKLGGQAKVRGVGGVWKDLTDSVNKMASNLTGQVRNIADVTTAVAKGDLSKKITVDVKGEILELKNTINTMVDQLNSFSSEVTRVAREVGTEGKLGGQAQVKGVGGTWKDLTDSVNQMASNLTGQVRNIADVTTAVARGDLSKKITVDVKGEILELKDTINTMVDQLNSFSSEVTRVAREVGSEGKLGGQAKVRGVGGVWKDLTDSVNQMASNLTGQVRNIAEVTTAVAKGDLSKKITVNVEGEILELKNTINTMVDQLNSFGAEVTRVAREVGSEGKLGGQAKVKGVGGTWKDLTDSVNQMASNLTGQVRNIAEVTTAVANGDLSKKITAVAEGEILELKKTINTMVDQLNSFSSEVTRVALEVGTEGKLGGQAKVKGVGGTWKDLTDSVNQMASNLTGQVRNIAEVTTAVAKGDLSRQITVDTKGEILELKNTINTMVGQLNSFASEVTRVAREVGTEGKLGGQAQVEGVGGTWKDLTDSVNQMASNLTGQVRNIAEVTTAVAKGDLSLQITVDVKGEILELKNTINTMVDQLRGFASEVTRVSREVGTEGKLGGQANVPGVAGTWKDLTDSVNQMAGNLTAQVRNIADVAIAVANGDMSRKITVDVRGEILQLKETLNTMVDQLREFASEVTRVAREVGTEGKLGGQANVPGVAGTWKDLTDSVNQMAGNLTTQVRNIAEVTIAVANGDMSKKITADVRGEILQLKETVNTMVDQLRAFASEVTRVAREVGTDGKLGGQAFVPGVAGTWKDLTDSVNQMASNLTGQVRNIADVTKAVANGDLSKQITVDVKGEILDLKNTFNTMVEQLNSFASEVTRVAREVGTEGKLGGQSEVKGVAGTWKDLTDSVNVMASNLTGQVRGIAKVVTSVAKGNLKQKLSIDAKGEVAQLTDTINEMIDTLATFSDQVTTVAREVGAEGKLGGQANVPGASGTWKNLTENVNQLAANLTTQVRAISEVASAVTQGDLTRTIGVEAKGEVEALKDTINQMISNLKATTLRNQEQDWLKSNLAKFTQMLQGQKELNSVTMKILSELAAVVTAQHGLFYILEEGEQFMDSKLNLIASYAYIKRKNSPTSYAMGEGLIGQVAIEKERIILSNVPKDYIRINSGLGDAKPKDVIILPVLFEGRLKAVIELASLDTFSQTHLDFLEGLTESIGIVLNTIESNSRTEELLVQSQSLASELKSQQEVLKNTNEELEEKAILLANQKEEVELKNQEVEVARKALEEKADQLTLTSKYKSEFLANMSHELRTPLNSLQILANELIANRDGNLSEKQIQFAKTINSCGDDLIQLINDILDLSKIESGYISVDYNPISFAEISRFVESTFNPISQAKHLNFEIIMDNNLPEVMETDSQRLNQILKNLLSNSFKFTEKGGVRLNIYKADNNWKTKNASLENAEAVVAFEISDTGIGISKEKQNIIFEAFQQAEGSTSRKYGGTGLGLSISRGLSDLLGGSIELESDTNIGSKFTLFLPLKFVHIPELEDINVNEETNVIHAGKSRLKSLPSASFKKSDMDLYFVDEVGDDRTDIKPNDKILLIAEDNITFAKILVERAHQHGIKAIVTTRGNDVVDYINQFQPHAITMDLNMPDTSGWKILDRLKTDFTLRHIPVYIISGEDERNKGLKRGARNFFLKPVKNELLTSLFNDIQDFKDKKEKNLLVVDDNEFELERIVEAVEGEDISVSTALTAKDAVKLIQEKSFDCIILDLMLPDADGLDLISDLENNISGQETAIIVHSAGDVNKKQRSKLSRFAHSIITKSAVSIDELVDQTALFMHRVHKDLPESMKDRIETYYLKEDVLINKKVLLVDDDVRNLFALTTALERFGLDVISAESGHEAIDILSQNLKIDIVLMDIMMPELDGYETMKIIRKNIRHKDLTIIAVTAKAMKGDRQRCIESGASDYITKPVNVEQLSSLMRVWLK